MPAVGSDLINPVSAAHENRPRNAARYCFAIVGLRASRPAAMAAVFQCDSCDAPSFFSIGLNTLELRCDLVLSASASHTLDLRYSRSAHAKLLRAKSSRCVGRSIALIAASYSFQNSSESNGWLIRMRWPWPFLTVRNLLPKRSFSRCRCLGQGRGMGCSTVLT